MTMKHASNSEREIGESGDPNEGNEQKQSPTPANTSSLHFGPPIYDNPDMLYELYEGPLTHLIMPEEGEEARDTKGRITGGLSLPPLRKERG